MRIIFDPQIKTVCLCPYSWMVEPHIKFLSQMRTLLFGKQATLYLGQIDFCGLLPRKDICCKSHFGMLQFTELLGLGWGDYYLYQSFYIKHLPVYSGLRIGPLITGKFWTHLGNWLSVSFPWCTLEFILFSEIVMAVRPTVEKETGILLYHISCGLIHTHDKISQILGFRILKSLGLKWENAKSLLL